MSTTEQTPLDPSAQPEQRPPLQRRPGLNTDTLALGALFLALFAFLAATLAVGIATRAADEHRALAASGAAGGSASTEAATVSLDEFALDPDALTVPEGSTLAVRNDGAVVHNLSVDGVASPMLNGGESGELDLSQVAPGSYTMRCDVPGHEAAGMSGTITIG